MLRKKAIQNQTLYDGFSRAHLLRILAENLLTKMFKNGCLEHAHIILDVHLCMPKMQDTNKWKG